jgi:hypothetical protein
MPPESGWLDRPVFYANMDFLFKILKVVLLGSLFLSQTGCATSDEDLDYTRKTVDTSGDSSYHGWAAPPKEVSQ